MSGSFSFPWRLELRLIWADRVSRWALVGGLLFLGWTLTSVVRDDRQRRAEWAESIAAFEAQRAADLDRLAEYERVQPEAVDDFLWDPRNPYFIGSNRGALVTRTPPPLGGLVHGALAATPGVLRIQAPPAFGEDAPPPPTHPARGSLGAVDLTLILFWLVPLLWIALATGLTSADRSRGLVPLLVAQGVEVHGIRLRRLLVRFGLLTLPLVVGLVIAALAMDVSIAAGRFWMLLGVVLVWNALWAGLVAWLDRSLRSPGAVALAGGAFWVAFTLLIPGLLANRLASHSQTDPVAVTAAVRQAAAEVTERADESVAAYLREHPEIDPSGRDAPGYAAIAIVEAEHVSERVDPLLSALDQEELRRERTIARWSLTSPVLLTARMLETVAGTSSDDARRFEAARDAFSTEWTETLRSRYFEWTGLTSSEVAGLPSRRSVDPARGAVLVQGVGAPLFILGGLSALLLLLGLRPENATESDSR